MEVVGNGTYGQVLSSLFEKSHQQYDLTQYFLTPPIFQSSQSSSPYLPKTQTTEYLAPMSQSPNPKCTSEYSLLSYFVFESHSWLWSFGWDIFSLHFIKECSSQPFYSHFLCSVKYSRIPYQATLPCRMINSHLFPSHLSFPPQSLTLFSMILANFWETPLATFACIYPMIIFSLSHYIIPVLWSSLTSQFNLIFLQHPFQYSLQYPNIP